MLVLVINASFGLCVFCVLVYAGIASVVCLIILIISMCTVRSVKAGKFFEFLALFVKLFLLLTPFFTIGLLGFILLV